MVTHANMGFSLELTCKKTSKSEETTQKHQSDELTRFRRLYLDAGSSCRPWSGGSVIKSFPSKSMNETLSMFDVFKQ